jgi:hypothetical protein
MDKRELIYLAAATLLPYYHKREDLRPTDARIMAIRQAEALFEDVGNMVAPSGKD